jgi:hypothetical protein
MFVIDPKKIEEINLKLDELFLVYDGRLLAAVLVNRVANTYSTLKAIGLENDTTLEKLFNFALDIAKAPPEVEPKVMYEGQNTSTKQ